MVPSTSLAWFISDARVSKCQKYSRGLRFGEREWEFWSKMGIFFKKTYFLFFARKAVTEQKASVFLSYPRAVFPAEAASGAGTDHAKSFTTPN